MGISDEDYAKALEEKRKRQAEEIQKLYQRQQMEKQSVAVQGGGSTITYRGISRAMPTNPIGLKVITEDNLNHDAMKAPLSALVDMWVMRWQGNWVNEGEFDEDDFWRLALVRLLGASKLEKHNLADQHRSVYRIIE